MMIVVMKIQQRTIVFEDELNTFLLKRLAKYKLQSQYIMVDNIPKNAMGKNKKDVKKILWPCRC